MHDPVHSVLFTSGQTPRSTIARRRRGRPRQQYLPSLCELATKTLNLLTRHLTTNFPHPIPNDLYYIKQATSINKTMGLCSGSANVHSARHVFCCTPVHRGQTDSGIAECAGLGKHMYLREAISLSMIYI